MIAEPDDDGDLHLDLSPSHAHVKRSRLDPDSCVCHFKFLGILIIKSENECQFINNHFQETKIDSK